LDILEEEKNVAIENLDKAENLAYYFVTSGGWNSLRKFMEGEW